MIIRTCVAIGCLFLSVIGVAATPDAPISLRSGLQPVTVVELFTSQGCSSCPPAEKWLNGFVTDRRLWKELIPVAFHVDYWDRLGWPDVYADAAYSKRQYNYRAQESIKNVYTPGLVVNGAEWRGWHLGNRRLEKPAGQVGELVANVSAQAIEARYSENRDNLALHVVLLGFGIQTEIERGENRNRTLDHEFVALQHRVYKPENGSWSVQLPQLNSHLAQRYGLALWVSEENRQGPIQATGGWLPGEWVVSGE